MTDRKTARQLAADALADGRPLDWFETLYRLADAGEATVPWADLRPNPHLVALERFLPSTGSAVCIGCGFGDDAEWLAARGLEVTAFDVAPSAIARCRARYPSSPVRYVVGDLLDADALGTFSVAVEVYTLQVLPPELRPAGLAACLALVAPSGILVLVARLREPTDPEGQMPWPLTRAELAPLDEGLLWLEDLDNPWEPGVRRVRAIWRR